MNHEHKYKIAIHRIKSALTFVGSYDEAYNQAVKEARRYNSEVTVTMVEHDFGSPQFFTVGPSTVAIT